MKTLWSTILTLLLAATVLWLGVACKTTPEQKIQTCEHAQAVLAAYQAAVDSGVVVKPEMIAGGKIAAAFLASYCGWTSPATRGARGDPPVDRNGVLIVHPPR